MVAYTVGHGARSTEELVAVLGSAGAGRLIDVRRHPGSKRHPHFGKDALARSLPALGVAYDWRGDVFGGRRNPSKQSRNIAWRVDAFRGFADHMESAEFQRALDRLVADAAIEPALAIMCAETLWWQCHRRLIADALVARGVPVVHLLDEKKHVEHTLHASARVDDRGLLAYDVGETVSLLE